MNKASVMEAGFRRVSFALRGGEMAGVAFGNESAHPDIVFLHATGFNALTYRAMLAPLGERFHVLALDLRGHGRTSLPPRRFGYVSWRGHAGDVAAVLEQHLTAPVTLAGHSLGATVSLLTAAARPDLVGGLAMIEPAILSAAEYATAELPGGPLLLRHTSAIARKAAARRARFADREAAAQALRGRGVFKSFTPDVLADYVADGFRECDAGVELACTPEYEAATFSAHRHDPWAALRRVHMPLALLRAETDSTLALAAYHRIAAMKPEARLAIVAGATHMLPMERPDRVRAAIESVALMARRPIDR